MKILFAMIGFAGCMTGSVLADDPKPAELAKKPQWQRVLTGEDAKQVAELEKRIADSIAKNDYANAIKSVDEVVAIRTRAQGGDHFSTIDRRHYGVLLRKIADFDENARRAWRDSLKLQMAAREHMRNRRNEEALTAYRTILDVRSQLIGDNQPEIANVLSSMAANLSALHRHLESRAVFQRALEIDRKMLGDRHPRTAHDAQNLALVLAGTGLFTESEVLYRSAIEILKDTDGESSDALANCSINLANCLNAQRRYADAHTVLIKVMSDLRASPTGAGAILHVGHSVAANNQMLQGRTDEAQFHYRQAYKMAVQVYGSDSEFAIRSRMLLAGYLEIQKKFDEALALRQASVAGATRRYGEFHPKTATQRLSLGGHYTKSDRYTEAHAEYERALAIYEKAGKDSHSHVATCLNHLAANLVMQGKLDEAVTCLRKARETIEQEDPDNVADIASEIANIATIENQKGNTVAALSLYQDARKRLGERLGIRHPDVVKYSQKVFFCLLQLGRDREAEEIARDCIESFELERTRRATGIDRSLRNLSNPHQLMALLKIKNDPVAAWQEIELTLSRGLFDQKDAPGPRDRDGEADYVQLRAEQTRMQTEISELVARPRLDEAENARLKDLVNRHQALDEAYYAKLVKRSVKGVADVRSIRNALSADSAILYYLDVQGEQLSHHSACVVRQSGDPKWERLPGTGPDGAWSQSDLELPDRFREAIASDSSKVESLAGQLHAQRIAPVLKHLDGVKTLYVVPVHTMAGVPVEVIAKGFTIGYIPSGSYLVRTRDSASPSGDRILAVGDPVFRTEESDPRKSIKTSALPPGGVLVTSVLPGSIAAKANLVPGDVLLTYGDAKPTDLASLQKAIAANEKNDTNTITIWRETADAPVRLEVPSGKLGIAIDADPAPTAVAARRGLDDTFAMLARGGEWKDLPGTRVETNRLQQLFGNSAKVFTDGSASEQTLESLRKSGELAKYRFFHFATHGEGNAVRAFESAIILAQDQLRKDAMPKAGEPWLNGQLSAREVLDYWKLNADLVTLSACETAIGKSGGGDGLLGFAQAFLTAGARSVCLSLWKVDDTATALLMSRFYENLLGKREGLTKPMGKAAALDEAKRWLRNLSSEEARALTAKISNGVARRTRGKGVDLNVVATEIQGAKPFAHPKFWAAFILIGDPE